MNAKLSFKERLAAMKAAAQAETAPVQVEDPKPVEAEPVVEQQPVAKMSFLEKMKQAKAEREAAEAATTRLETVAPVGSLKAKLDAEAVPVVPVAKPFAKKNAFLERLEANRNKVADNAEASLELDKAVEKQQQQAEVKPTVSAEAGLTFLQKLLAAKAAAQAEAEQSETLSIGPADQPEADSEYNFGAIKLNEQQAKAPALAARGESFVLTGAAGTGKTATQAAVVESLDKAGAFKLHDFKYIGDAPSIALVAFTKVAVRNIQKALRKNPNIARYANHCMTVHALLEFQPVYEERYNAETGDTQQVRIFRPQRTSANPLKLTHLVVEEASMIGTDLWALLYDALPTDVQIVFLGDINQIKPVFGDPILAYALKQLEVIELTEVYRTEDGSPIIPAAHEVLNGRPFTNSDCGRVSIVSGKSKYKVTQAMMGRALGAAFQKLYEAGDYDPDLDIILCPWNKREMGTIAINEAIATYLGNKRGALVQEVRAGFNRWWLAEGDKVLVDKRQGYIVNISPNPKYVGAACMPAGSYTRSGVPIIGDGTQANANAEAGWDELADYSDFSLSDIEDEESTSRAGSHIVTVRFNDQDDDDFSLTELRNSGEFAPAVFQFGYALTVHKSQGSEWRNVYFMAHYDHLGFLCRELIYTALTRASESFTFFGKEDLLAKAVQKVDIKGDTLIDKIEYFSSGLRYDESIRTTKPSVKLADH